MNYRVSSSSADSQGDQLCKMFGDLKLRCAGGCETVLPVVHIHLWFEGADFATGVCSEACAGAAIRKRTATPTIAAAF